MSTYLQQLVVNEVQRLGPEKASEFFGVSPQLARQWVAGSKPVSLAAVEKVFSVPELKSTEAAWDGKKVMLLLPWYRTTNPLTAFALLALLNREKMGVAMEFGDAFIAHARNVLIDRLITTGVEWGFMLDDDMIPPMGNAAWFRKYTGSTAPDEFTGMHALNKLLSRQKSLIGALYFGRKPKGRAMYYDALIGTAAGEQENLHAHTAPRDEVREVQWVATGALLIHRSVALDMREKMPWLAPKTPGEPWQYFSNASDALLQEFDKLRDETADVHNQVLAGTLSLDGVEKFLSDTRRRLDEAMASVNRDNRLQSGEDAIFGIRARKCGHPSFVDMSVVCGHVGSMVYGAENTR